MLWRAGTLTLFAIVASIGIARPPLRPDAIDSWTAAGAVCIYLRVGSFPVLGCRTTGARSRDRFFVSALRRHVRRSL
jgi:hypothetical protein